MVKLTPGGAYLICGRGGTGKTHILKYLVAGMASHFATAFGFCPTRFAGNLDFIPEKRCFEKFDPEKVEAILDYQAQAVKQGTAGNVLLVFDDVLGNVSLKLYGHLFLRLATTARHYRVTIIITTQYIHKVPPALRENARFILITSVDTPKAISVLYDEYGINGITKKAFTHYCEQYTQGYSVLLINREAKTQKESYIQMQAPTLLPDFTL